MRFRKIIEGLLAVSMLSGYALMPDTGNVLDIISAADSESGLGRAGEQSENGFAFEVIADGTAAIIGCDLKGDIVIPSEISGYKVTKINNQLFYNMVGITSVRIPETVSYIDEWGYAFSYCYNLEKIIVDDGNPYFCSVDGVLFNKNMSVLYNYPCSKAGAQYTVPDSVNYICCTGFARALNLRALYISDADTYWRTYTFYGDGDLTVYCKKGGKSESTANTHISKDLAGNGTYPTYKIMTDAAVSGTITVSGGTEAIAGTKMSIKNADGTDCGVEIEIASDGTFTVTGTLPDGDYTITASKSKCCPRDYTVTIEDGQMTGELNVELQLYGDVDNNGIVTLDDVIDVINYFNKKTSAISSADGDLQDYLIAVSDVDGDGVIKLDDAIEMINYFNKKASAFDRIA